MWKHSTIKVLTQKFSSLYSVNSISLRALLASTKVDPKPKLRAIGIKGIINKVDDT
jgi:hypothetical protein